MTAGAASRPSVGGPVPGKSGPVSGMSSLDLRIGQRLAGALPAIAVFIAVLVAWELVLGALGVQQFLVPRPSVIAAAFVD